MNDREKQMIEEWLKSNEPSIKDNVKCIPHLNQTIKLNEAYEVSI